MTAKKNDKLDNKPDHSLLSPVFKDQVSYCMMAGAIKYGTFNYLKGHTIRQLMAATSRHMDKILAGEDYDEDTTNILEKGYTRPDGTFIPGIGKRILITHNACICANQLMFLDQKKIGTLKDDRYKAVPRTIKVRYNVEHALIGGGSYIYSSVAEVHSDKLDEFLERFPDSEVIDD